MVTLYSFGPGFGLPDPSPFVTKAEVLLKMAELPYRSDTTGFKKAPKRKLPYIMTAAKSFRIRPLSAGTWRISTTSISIAGLTLSSGPLPGPSRR